MKTAKNPQAFDLIIFDLDGTLIDSKLDIAFSVNHTLASLSLEMLPVDTITSFVGKGVKNLLRQALGEYAHAKFEPAIKIFRRHYGEHCLDKTVLYPSVKKTMESLGGFKKVIVTNKPAQFAAPILKGLEIAHFFETVLGGDDVQQKKPAPEPVYFLLEKLNVRPDKAIVVGDSPLDMQMGKAAGIRTCAVTYGYGKKEDLSFEQPDYLIDDLFELIHLVIGSS